MKDKFEVSSNFKNFNNMVQTQFATKIPVLRTDNAKDYFNSTLGEYLSNHSIIHQNSYPYTPQQNGIVEWKNRHLLEIARSIMFTSHLPKYFWEDAILTATYLINHMSSRVLNFQSSLSVLQNRYPYCHLVSKIPLRVFGCSTFVHNLSPHRSKFDPKSIKCIFLEYSPN